MPTIFAIESSCDETSAAVVSDRQILSNVISSQIAIHAPYGGVVPEVAARHHLEIINDAIAQALTESGKTWPEIDGVAVTVTPGLIGSLMIGVTAAKTLAMLHAKPLIGIHHLEGHICSAYLADPTLEPPFLCLLVSGGHSHLIVVQAHGDYQVVGRSRDDAAGEAFDKVARLLGLGYPGGPAIDRIATDGNPKAFPFPQGRIPNAPYDSSFSGLKTAVLRLTQKLQADDPATPLPVADIAASFQATVANALAQRAIHCATAFGLPTIVAVGGVAANRTLRAKLLSLANEQDLNVVFPPLRLCTDNAAMIACAGVMRLQQGQTSGMTISPRSRLSLEECTLLYDGV